MIEEKLIWYNNRRDWIVQTCGARRVGARHDPYSQVFIIALLY
jgi:hypothetical protein